MTPGGIEMPESTKPGARDPRQDCKLDGSKGLWDKSRHEKA